MFYVSFLHVEVNHRHPVLLVFCDVLLDTLNTRKSKSYGTPGGTHLTSVLVETTEHEVDPGSTVHDGLHGNDHVAHDLVDTQNISGFHSSGRLARNRWLKAYTLLRNPALKAVKLEDSFEIVELTESLSVYA